MKPLPCLFWPTGDFHRRAGAGMGPAVDKALLAAPANLREDATVVKWKPDFTCDTCAKAPPAGLL